MDNLIFCGLSHAGKSTWAKKVAAHLSRRFIDTDQLIEEKEGLTCPEICLNHGEAYFRAREREVIENLQSVKKSIIALGGGSLVNPDNRSLVKKIGMLIYLEADPLVVWSRRVEVPSYVDFQNPQESFLALAKDRQKVYEELADKIFDHQTVTLEEIIQSGEQFFRTTV